jgi:inhibitor of KinA
MEIIPLGDSALILRVGGQLEDAAEETLNEVLEVRGRLEDAHIPGVIELTPAYTTVAIFFDPVRVINDAAEPERVIDLLIQKIRESLPPGER